MEEVIDSYDKLIDSLIDNKITMVGKPLYETCIRNLDKLTKLEGDIVECGVWRGGYSIFLSHLFPEKNVWVCDSYEGFQPEEIAKYKFDGERHIPQYTMTPHGPIGISLEEVQSYFNAYGLEGEDRIKFLKGFVKESLPNSGIEKISILRIDVDGYSPTMETLDELYPKVVKGGFIIFDDAPLQEAATAIRDYFQRENILPKLRHKTSDKVFPLTYENMVDILSNPNINSRSYEDETAGCYLIKE